MMEQQAPDDPADMMARRLSRWQIIDMVYIHRNGRMEIGRRADGKTRAPVQRMLDEGIVMLGGSGQYVLPGKRFEAVLEALHRAGLISTVEIPKPAGKL
jgi:hypothetical protein